MTFELKSAGATY
jgi:hypothetical protein